VEPKTEMNADAVEAACAQLQHQVKAMIGVSSKIKMNAVGSLPRSEGKAKRVVDSR
jgi:phenylacetate-CoA ligase